MTDELKFADEATPAPGRPRNAWTVLIVDDDPEVHTVTALALEGFRFAGRCLHFLHARTGSEAMELLRQHPETAIVLLDVVMETEHAGLEVVEFVRNELMNKFVRIILRTGQPGQAPELDVITRYDINDYKYKTELTRERLFTTVYTALSTYRDLVALDHNRHGLEKIIDATPHLFTLDSMDQLAQGVLEQLIALLFLEEDSVLLHASGVAANAGKAEMRIVAATGAFASKVGAEAHAALPPEVVERIEAARTSHKPIFSNHYYAGAQNGSAGTQWVFYVTADVPLREPDRHLIELFCRNVSLAREHVLMRAETRHPSNG
jgi:CheY-like chemotaxis protein